MPKIRVLHVVAGVARGGVESWVLDVLQHIDRDRFQLDLLVFTTKSEVFGEQVRALGSEVIPCPGHRRPWRFARSFRQALREHGPYDVIHAQVSFYNGIVLRLAERAGIQVRVAHSHADPRYEESHSGLFRRLFYALMRRWMLRHATAGVAASNEAGLGQYGKPWETDPRFRLLYCGINLEPFRQEVDPKALRAGLGLPEGAFVMGHVGRFHHQKNHAFLVEVAAAVVKRDPNAYLLLVGEGELREAVEQQVAQCGLSEHVIFTGPRGDVPRLLLGAMDVVVLPSFYEGLPLVGLEAQMAGLPMVFADNISGETDFIPRLVRRRSLGEPASAWAEEVLAVRDAPRPVGRAEALKIMEGSPFTIRESVRQLEQLYVEAVG
jgi:glycosyltransferase involved in cell wall biosynthesis